MLERLVDVARADAAPPEVGPVTGPGDPSPDAPPQRWTDARVDAFRAWHRAESLDPDRAGRTFAVLLTAPPAAADVRNGAPAGGPDGPRGPAAGGEPCGEVIGAARLTPVPGEAGTVEAGLWLARGHRARGHGGAVVRALRDLARADGAHRLLATTTVDNEASRRLLTTELGAHPLPPGATTLTVRAHLSPAAVLLSRPAPAGQAPPFPGEAPDTPGPLVLRWLREAADAGVGALQAATLATVDGDGNPDARVLVLRDVSPDGASWTFATDRGSPKGRQLAANPGAALTLHWPEQARQLRVRGKVTAGSREEAAAEFRTRSPAARVAARTGHQSEALTSDDAYREAEAAARATVSETPDAVPAGHTVYTLHAGEVEFWQGSPDRFHQRLHYRRTDDGWNRRRLWP
nr:pyridoxal 5'-phosphate synthase [Streptomyces spiramenti]